MLSLKCGFCGIAATLKCSGCKNVFYCGKEHQKLDWKKSHKVKCKCYEIASNSYTGRFMRANRDIKCGEIILCEKPLVFGPKIISSPTCLGCNRFVEAQDIRVPTTSKERKVKTIKNYYKCSKCKWPMCNESCEQSKAHVDECNLMAQKKFRCNIDFNADEVNKKESAYCAIVPLRCLLMKTTNPAGFQKFFQLQDHLYERLRTPIYGVLKSNLLTFFKTILSLDEFDETTILKTAAILDINSFEIRLTNGRGKIRAVFAETAIISHDCVPNTYHVFDDNMQIILIASVDIKKNEIIATSYGQSLQSTIARRLHLRQTKCFDCVCERCSDPTECGTFSGSLICPRCKSGKLLSNNPLDDGAQWKCNVCTMQMNAPNVSLINNRLQFEIENLPKQSPYDLELFLEKYCHRNGTNTEVLLHQTNSFVLQIKYALTQLYGNVSGFLLHELGDTDLERKIILCKELIQIAEIVEPGFSHFRGKLLLDLHSATLLQAKRRLKCGAITKEEAQDLYKSAVDVLNEANIIFNQDASMQATLEDNFRKLAIILQD